MESSEARQELRPVVQRELRRARRHLLGLIEGVSETDLERPARRAGASMKWHLGHAAFLERQHLARLVGPLDSDVVRGCAQFLPQGVDEREGDLPLLMEILGWLRASRRLTEMLVANLALEPRALDVFRDMVDADHAQARYLRLRRSEMGLPALAEPESPLLLIDTDCEAPPRHHLDAWACDAPPRDETALAEIVSLEDHRHSRALDALDRGHRLAGTGDPRGALRCFEESAGWEASADALTYQAWMHSLLGQGDRAERLCLRAIEMDPEFGNPYNDLGTLCLQRRDVDAAISWFERAKRARRYEPRHFPFVNLGRLYLALGRPREALTEFEGAFALSPGSEDIRGAIERLRRELSEA